MIQTCEQGETRARTSWRSSPMLLTIVRVARASGLLLNHGLPQPSRTARTASDLFARLPDPQFKLRIRPNCGHLNVNALLMLGTRPARHTNDILRSTVCMTYHTPSTRNNVFGTVNSQHLILFPEKVFTYFESGKARVLSRERRCLGAL